MISYCSNLQRIRSVFFCNTKHNFISSVCFSFIFLPHKGYIFGCIFMWSVMDTWSSWWFADLRVPLVFRLLHYVCCLNNFDSWISDGKKCDTFNAQFIAYYNLQNYSLNSQGSIMGSIQLVDCCGHIVDTRADICYDYDDTILGEWKWIQTK